MLRLSFHLANILEIPKSPIFSLLWVLSSRILWVFRSLCKMLLSCICCRPITSWQNSHNASCCRRTLFTFSVNIYGFIVNRRPSVSGQKTNYNEDLSLFLLGCAIDYYSSLLFKNNIIWDIFATEVLLINKIGMVTGDMQYIIIKCVMSLKKYFITNLYIECISAIYKLFYISLHIHFKISQWYSHKKRLNFSMVRLKWSLNQNKLK